MIVRMCRAAIGTTAWQQETHTQRVELSPVGENTDRSATPSRWRAAAWIIAAFLIVSVIRLVQHPDRWLGLGLPIVLNAAIFTLVWKRTDPRSRLSREAEASRSVPWSRKKWGDPFEDA